MAEQSVTANDLIGKYIELRDRKEAMVEQQKQELAPLEKKLDLCKAGLQKIMQDLGVKQVKGEEGTAFIVQKKSTRVDSWEDALGWIRDHERWDVLERRVNKTVALEENIPGITINTIIDTQIRRS